MEQRQGTVGRAGPAGDAEALVQQRVSECRSALTSVFLHSTLPGAMVEMLRSQFPRAERPMRLGEAVEVLKPGAPEPGVPEPGAPGPSRALTPETLPEQGAPATYPSRARQVAAGFLAEGYFFRGRRFLDGPLSTLLDREHAVDDLREGLFAEGAPAWPPPTEDLTRATFGLPRVALAPDGDTEPPRRVQTALDFDPETLTTTVTATVTTTLDFEALTLLLDPRAWALSMFWKQAYRVAQAGNPTLLPNPSEPPGYSWRGPFFEFFEFNWNASALSSFQNYLDIHYEVDRHARRIDMRFFLHSCQSCNLAGLESSSGIDVDSGFVTARPVRALVSDYPPREASRARAAPEPRDIYRITSQKKLRFTDLLPELPPTPDFMGRGLLVLLTPALLTLWLREMLAGIYILEKRYQDNPPTLAAHGAPVEGPAPPSRPSRGGREPPARRQ